MHANRYIFYRNLKLESDLRGDANVIKFQPAIVFEDDVEFFQNFRREASTVEYFLTRSPQAASGGIDLYNLG